MEKDQNATSNKIFVAAIPAKSTKESLHQYFSAFGIIRSVSKIFKIGKKRTNCCIVDCEHHQTKESILSEVHLINNRYLDCKEYLRGNKLKSQIQKIQKSNVFIPKIPDSTNKRQLIKMLKEVIGSVEHVKIGYSIKEKSRYAIVTFSGEELASKAFRLQFWNHSNFKFEFKGYIKAKVKTEKQNNEVLYESRDSRQKGGKAIRGVERELQETEFVKKRPEAHASEAGLQKLGNATYVKKHPKSHIGTGGIQIANPPRSFQKSDIKSRIKLEANAAQRANPVGSSEDLAGVGLSQQPTNDEPEVVVNSNKYIPIGFNSRISILEVLKLSRGVIEHNHTNRRNLAFKKGNKTASARFRKRRNVRRKKKKIVMKKVVHASHVIPTC